MSNTPPTLRNWRVHHDGTGHGLGGLDDNGELPGFEQWSRVTVGRGYDAISISPALQIEYIAKRLGEMTARYGSPFTATRVWHRGPNPQLYNDARGVQYEQLIRGHIAALFR